MSRTALLKSFDEEISMIENEFALLQRQDFVDFIKQYSSESTNKSES